ncbi:MAG TPA: hypothetical protein VG537_01335 [Candidatus Kapabacteria bacterium]|nr:hypothetical protein [Candidatus Kapabacteria bacterium]
MKQLFLTVTASFSIVAIGCNDGAGPQPVKINTSVIMPLAVGNRWIGQITDYDARGEITSQKFDTLNIYKSRVISGETWYYLDHFPRFSISGDTAQYQLINRSDGLYECDSEHFGQATLIAKYPAMPQDTFSTSTDASTGFFYEDVVDTVDQQIIVPSGKFRCNVYHFEGFGRVSSDVIDNVVGPEQFYAPGIGLIENGYVNVNGSVNLFGTEEIWELVRADLH